MEATARTLEATARRDARIIRLQNALFDHSGHVRRGLSKDDTRMLIGELNRERAANGWKPMDMTGRWFPRGIPA